ncbi:MAG: hypothetical protein Q7J75_00780 [Rhodoferax sp.]|nr:hypothetical protein [Rhodoferax sp.]
MKAWWSKITTRVDALSLRERAFMFLSVIAIFLALADVMWLSPAQVAHKQLTQRFQKQTVELQRVRDELKLAGLPANGVKSLSAEIATVKASLATVNQKIAMVLPTASDSTPLTQALVHLLRRHEGLTLVRTATALPDASLAKTSQTGGSGLPVGMTRQGVELTVSGSYPELMRYVQALETAMPNIRWGVMKLKSEKMPPELTLQLFLIGVQP